MSSTSPKPAASSKGEAGAAKAKLREDTRRAKKLNTTFAKTHDSTMHYIKKAQESAVNMVHLWQLLQSITAPSTPASATPSTAETSSEPPVVKYKRIPKKVKPAVSPTTPATLMTFEPHKETLPTEPEASTKKKRVKAAKPPTPSVPPGAGGVIRGGGCWHHGGNETHCACEETPRRRIISGGGDQEEDAKEQTSTFHLLDINLFHGYEKQPHVDPLIAEARSKVYSDNQKLLVGAIREKVTGAKETPEGNKLALAMKAAGLQPILNVDVFASCVECDAESDCSTPRCDCEDCEADQAASAPDEDIDEEPVTTRIPSTPANIRAIEMLASMQEMTPIARCSSEPVYTPLQSRLCKNCPDHPPQKKVISGGGIPLAPPLKDTEMQSTCLDMLPPDSDDDIDCCPPHNSPNPNPCSAVDEDLEEGEVKEDTSHLTPYLPPPKLMRQTNNDYVVSEPVLDHAQPNNDYPFQTSGVRPYSINRAWHPKECNYSVDDSYLSDIRPPSPDSSGLTVCALTVSTARVQP